MAFGIQCWSPDNAEVVASYDPISEHYRVDIPSSGTSHAIWVPPAPHGGEIIWTIQEHAGSQNVNLDFKLYDLRFDGTHFRFKQYEPTTGGYKLGYVQPQLVFFVRR